MLLNIQSTYTITNRTLIKLLRIISMKAKETSDHGRASTLSLYIPLIEPETVVGSSKLMVLPHDTHVQTILFVLPKFGRMYFGG